MASSTSPPNQGRALQQTQLGTYYLCDSINLLRNALGKKLQGKVQLILTSPPFPLNHKKSHLFLYSILCVYGLPIPSNLYHSGEAI